MTLDMIPPGVTSRCTEHVFPSLSDPYVTLDVTPPTRCGLQVYMNMCFPL